MRALFMGTPQVAADVLKDLAKHWEIVGVFCQPDKPVGRKQLLTPPSVKLMAEELGLNCYQPKSVRKEETLQLIRQLKPDIIAVVAYGKILPQELLDIPVYGAFNLHGSLLPKYRGSAPIQRSIIDGQPVGMTVMCMAAGCDEGDMLRSTELELSLEEDVNDAFRKLGQQGGQFLIDAVEGYINGTIAPVKQRDEDVTFAPMLEKEEAAFSFVEPAETIVNKVRGMAMWPCAQFTFEGKKIKVHKAYLSSEQSEPGKILSLKPLTVAASKGSVILDRVTPEGGKEMNGTDWARGRRFAVGDRVE